VEDAKFIEDLLNLPGLTKHFHDLKVTWPIILGCVGISIVLSLVLSVLIRYCAGCMVWSIIILLYLVLGFAGTFCFLLRNTDWVQELVSYQTFPGELKDDDLLLGIAITCWTFLGILLLLTCCFYTQIRISKFEVIQQSESCELLPTSSDNSVHPTLFHSTSLFCRLGS
jgi:amino acid transporter